MGISTKSIYQFPLFTTLLTSKPAVVDVDAWQNGGLAIQLRMYCMLDNMKRANKNWLFVVIKKKGRERDEIWAFHHQGFLASLVKYI